MKTKSATRSAPPSRPLEQAPGAAWSRNQQDGLSEVVEAEGRAGEGQEENGVRNKISLHLSRPLEQVPSAASCGNQQDRLQVADEEAAWAGGEGTAEDNIHHPRSSLPSQANRGPVLRQAKNQQDRPAAVDERSGRADGEETEEKQDTDHNHTRKSPLSRPLKQTPSAACCRNQQDHPGLKNGRSLIGMGRKTSLRGVVNSAQRRMSYLS